MVSLGSFGKVRPAEADVEPVTFDWFGLTVGVVVDFNQVELVDLMELASTVDETDPAAMRIVKDMLRLVIQPDDFDAFWAQAKTSRQQIEDLVELGQALMEAATDRPTRQPSGSSPGRQAIEGNSPAVSDLPGRPGRPDIVILREDAELDRRRMMAAAAG